MLAEGLEEVCWLEDELWDDAWLDDAWLDDAWLDEESAADEDCWDEAAEDELDGAWEEEFCAAEELFSAWLSSGSDEDSSSLLESLLNWIGAEE